MVDKIDFFGGIYYGGVLGLRSPLRSFGSFQGKNIYNVKLLSNFLCT